MVLEPAPVRLGLTCRSWDVAGHENGTALEPVTGRLGGPCDVLGMETDSESAWFGTSVG